MKLKSLFFGSAAVFAVGTGAQAADLPIAEPVEYVQICDAFGNGFYYIPNTDTCLKIGGRVRVETHYVENDPGTSNDNNWTTRARGYISLDARTQTDWGLLRAYTQMFMTVGPKASSAPEGQGGQNYDQTFSLDKAFIQIVNGAGTITAGYASSNFDAPFSSNTFGTRIGIDDPTTTATQFAYTFAGGNGFSATIAIEDAASAGRRFEGPVDDYEGQELLDVVGNVRFDWGDGNSALVSGVVHHIHDVNGDGWGWAINGGFNLAFGMFTAGLTAGYADGAIGYITNDFGGTGDFDGPDGDDTNQAWSIRGGVGVNFTPTMGAFLDASWTETDADTAAGVDATVWAIAADIQWTPIPGLLIGPEVAWRNTDIDGGADLDEWGAMFRIQRTFGPSL
jgi:hypothetical protein